MVRYVYVINNYMKHKLMIKTHNETKLKYLCYTRTEGEEYANYKGSGKHWKRHLKKHGDHITTEMIFETEDKEEFKKVATNKSIELDIVNSPQWANLKIEEGDGGDTVSNRMWVTNGSVDKYMFKNDEIPTGWKRGRSKCVFNDKDKQKEFGARADVTLRGKKIKEAWDSGKMSHRKTHRHCGDDNPMRRPEVKKKVCKVVMIEGVVYQSMGELAKAYGVSNSVVSHWKRQGKVTLV